MRHSALSRGLAERAEKETAQRALVDAQRGRTVELRLTLARIRSEQQAAERDRQRIADERQGSGGAGGIGRGGVGQAAAGGRRQPRRRAGAAQRGDRATEGRGGRIGDDRRATWQRWSDGGRASDRRSSSCAVRQRRTTRTPARPRRRRDEAAADVEIARKRFGAADEAAQAARAALDRAAGEEARLSRAALDAAAVVSALRGRLASAERGLDAASHAALGRAVRARGGTLAAEGVETDSGAAPRRGGRAG